MSYTQTLKYLYGLQNRGMKFGLRNTRAILRDAGNPERTFPSIHIAGTNGKGSTASFLASIFMEAGFRTGLYTSPHLVRFTERIRIDGVEIPEERLVSYAEQMRPMVESVSATFFEATTCIAFQYFAIAPVRDLGLRDGIVAAVRADTLSLSAFEVGMFGWMILVQLVVFPVRHLHPDALAFWFFMQVGMVLGFVTAYPVNWWLVQRGFKERM